MLYDENFEWDERKAKRNARAHGVTFELARLVFDDPNAIDRLDLDETDEDRVLITGLVGDCVLCPARTSHSHHLGSKSHLS
jgi:uncharacterized DUF497 family protein